MTTDIERMKRKMRHSDICFGHWMTCGSCGCNRKIGIPCISHRDSEGYKIYLMEEMLKFKKNEQEASGDRLIDCHTKIKIKNESMLEFHNITVPYDD